MAKNFYRRHKRACKAGRPKDFCSGEFEERKKGWQRCDCPIFVSGTENGSFYRRSTGAVDWEAAREYSGASDTALVAMPVPQILPPDAPCGDKTTVKEASRAFLGSHARSAKATRVRYGYLMNSFLQFSEARGYVYLYQWRVIDIREFRDGWGVSASTSIKQMSTVRSFFKFCMENEWLEKNPAVLVRNPRGRDDNQKAERIPFSDAELERMYSACDNLYDTEKDAWNRRWTGQDLADFISLSVYTGLRISDVATFHIDKLLPSGEIHLFTTKGGKKVYTWVPQWLQDRIRERARTVGPEIFGAHNTTDIKTITDQWRRKLIKLWDLCGLMKGVAPQLEDPKKFRWSAKPTPHRFRHTFARILLQKHNLTARDVAELLGNTEKIVLKHYAAWMPERQERLTKLLQDAFQDKPTPGNVVAMRLKG